jgi:polyisoprenoid-binding protein YceI
MSEATATTELTALTGTYAIDASHSRLGFSAKHAMVTTVRGAFKDFEGALVLDGANPSASSATVVVKTASFDSGVADRDAHVRNEDFLDVEKFPTLTFTSSKIVQDGDDYVVTGDLTIKDVTRAVDLKLEFEGTQKDPWGNDRVGFTGETAINRKDFNLSWNVALDKGGVLVSEKVKIQLDISAVKSA